MVNGKKNRTTRSSSANQTAAEQEPAAQTDQESGQDGGDEVVTLSTVRTMLNVQESMFKAIFDSLVSNLTSRVDVLVTTVSEIKSSLEFTQGELDDLKPVREKVQSIENEIKNVQDAMEYQRDKVEYLENQSRRNNLRVDGIPEEENESWEKTEEKTKAVLREKLHIDFEVQMERAHRTGKRRVYNRDQQQATPRPRTIICKLRDWKQKEALLKEARRVKPEGIYLNEDLAPETLERRKEQMPKLHEAKRAGKIAYFVLDRLVIKDKIPSRS